MNATQSIHQPPHTILDPRLVELLRDSDACNLLRDHVDRYALRLAVEGRTDYLLDELFRSDRLLAHDPGGDSRVALLARAWNRCSATTRRALTVVYLAPRVVDLATRTVKNAHASWRGILYAERAEAMSRARRVA
jgi:hypothetical protein